MPRIFYARTDMTGDLARHFAQPSDAIAWAKQNYFEAAYVCQIEVPRLTVDAVVDLLNMDSNNDCAEVIWEVAQ